MPDMRFAPPKQLRIVDRAGGLNPERVRSYNEKLVLSLLLQSDGISRLEIGERSRLSAQTVSVIVRSLEQEGLVVQGEAVRGRVGPPTNPILLNREGAYSVGISVTASRIDIVLIDFLGRVRQHSTLPSDGQLTPASTRAVAATVKETLLQVPDPARARVTGVGFCLPALDLLSMQPASHGDSGSRMHADLEAAIGLPVFMQDDITAAAGAEMMFGTTKRSSDYLFFFVAEVLYSRLVLNNHIYLGNYAVAPASHDIGTIVEAHQSPQGQVAAWLERCLGRLSELASGLAQFVDYKTVVIAGETTDLVTRALRDSLQSKMPTLHVVAGNTGPHARAVGAGSLPFISRFTVQH